MKVNRFLIGILVLIFIFIALYFTNNIGLTKKMVEKEARHYTDIDDSFTLISDESKDLKTLLFFNKDEDKYKYRIYAKKPGISFGYFFRGGGTLVSPDNYIEEIHIAGYHDRVFISSNKNKVGKVEIDDGNEIKIIDVDINNPFIVIIPQNTGIVNFYNIENKQINSIKYDL